MRGRQDWSDLIYSQRSYAVVPIKSSGLMLPPSPSHPQVPAQPGCQRVAEGRVSLTQEQQMNTIQKDSMMPAMPTTQVSRRKRMTPKMFCRHGRYTPMKVPMRGACGRPVSVSAAPDHYETPRPTPSHLFLHPPLSYSLHPHPFNPLATDSYPPPSSHLPALYLHRPSCKPPPPSSLQSLSLISHPFRCLCPQLLSLCLHHAPLHLNLLFLPNLFFPKALTCTGFFLPPSLFSASSCSLLPWGRLV